MTTTYVPTTEAVAQAREVLRAASARGDDVSQLWESLTIAIEDLVTAQRADAERAISEVRHFASRHGTDRPQPYRPPADVPESNAPEPGGLIIVPGQPDPDSEPRKHKWWPWQ